MSKNFILTLNEATLEFYQDVVEYVTGLSQFQYMLVTEHVGQENKHYHMYLQYRSGKRLTPSRLHGAHFDPCLGSAQKNIAYLKCEDEKHIREGVTAILIDERGEPILKGKWTIKRLREESDDDQIPANLFNINKKIKNEKKSADSFHNMLDEIEKNDLKGPEVIYFIGKPGYGKTFNAYKYALQRYNKEDITKVTINNNFFKFTGSINDKCLIVEEFRASQLHPSSLLQFTDKYGYECPIKGDYKYVRPECIIICSIIHPSRLYKEEHDELNEQFTRRITHLYEVEKDHKFKEISLNEQVSIGGYPIGYLTDFNDLEFNPINSNTLTEVEVTDNWDDHVIIN